MTRKENNGIITFVEVMVTAHDNKFKKKNSRSLMNERRAGEITIADTWMINNN